MPVEMMCIAPHGSVVVPELRYYQYTQPTLTTQALLKLRDIAHEKKIEHFVIIDPHADRHTIPGKISIIPSQVYRFSIGRTNDVNAITCVYDTDNILQQKIKSIKHTSFYSYEHFSDVEKVSWGSGVPLYMIAENQSVTILTVDRQMPRQEMHEVATLIYNLLDSDERNIGIIFSADLSHSWSKDYKQFPYHKNSKVYDDYVTSLIKTSTLEQYLVIDEIVDTASTCAHGPLQLLAEMCKNKKYKSSLLSYEVPSYYGMAVSSIEFEDSM